MGALDRKKLIERVAQNDEDRVLLAHVLDRMLSGAQRNIPASTAFLTGREQELCKALLHAAGISDTCFFGGTETAERKVLCYIPDYYEREDYLYSEDGPVCALRAEISDYDTLSHRDFLGAILGMGVKREILGDLYVSSDHCDMLVLREMASYLLSQLTQIGRARVRVSELPLQELTVPEQRTKTIRDTVASMRLDSVLASGFQIGRSRAQSLIASGRVEVNHFPVLKADSAVEEGAVISARGLGKLRVTAINGKTRKDRISLVLDRYL